MTSGRKSAIVTGVDMTEDKRKNDTVYSLEWYRFEEYAIVGGHIRPAAGARLRRYDVSDLSDDRSTRVSTIYHELSAIGRVALGSDEFFLQRGQYPQALQKLVLEWCSKYGLLGILNHHLISLHLAPRWLHQDLQNGTGPLVPTAIYSSNTDFGWHQHHISYAGKLPQSINPPQAGSLVTMREVLSDPRMYPHAVVWTGSRHEVQTIGSALLPYFPDMNESSSEATFMRPHDEQWCQGYSEPIIDFVAHAKVLFVELKNLADLSLKPSLGAHASNQDLHQSLEIMNSYMTRRQTRLRLTPRGIVNKTEHASLLAFLSELAWEDMKSRPYIRTCANGECQTPFSSKSARARYCSAKCQNTDRWRSRELTKLNGDTSAVQAVSA